MDANFFSSVSFKELFERKLDGGGDGGGASK